MKVTGPLDDEARMQAYKQYLEQVREVAMRHLAPCKNCGASHLASIVGRTFTVTHNEMTLICAGVNEPPTSREKRAKLSTDAAVTALLVNALIKCAADPNTQWDDATLFYAQLVNHFENLLAGQLKAEFFEVPK